jgi:hypothetical protein
MSDPSVDAKPAPANDRSKLAMRLLHLILVGLLIGAATAVLHVLTVVQFIVMLADGGKANAQIAAFGKSLGLWLAKAARFQTAETEDKPWPWSPLD